MSSSHRMCSLVIECVHLSQSVTGTVSNNFLQNVFSYHRMCSLVIECVLLSQSVTGTVSAPSTLENTFLSGSVSAPSTLDAREHILHLVLYLRPQRWQGSLNAKA